MRVRRDLVLLLLPPPPFLASCVSPLLFPRSPLPLAFPLVAELGFEPKNKRRKEGATVGKRGEKEDNCKRDTREEKAVKEKQKVKER